MQNASIKRAFTAAFPRTLPVFAGYCFLGMTYGIYLNTSGLPLWFPLLMSLTIFSGSAEIIAVGFMLEAFNPLNALVVALMTGARYLFYGISMLDRFRGTGLKKFYLIYGMVDESFSINYQAVLSPDIDKGWFYFFVTLLDHGYWIFGAVSGGLLGSLIGFDTTGLDFVMTAMFVVIFMNQWMAEKRHLSELIGVAVTLVCLILFGADNFIIPTMAAILLALTLAKKPLEKTAEENEAYKIMKAKEASGK
ncbi:MAG: AzlC family ABC transporter permease [Clostridia bacterium]|nr:AzlC family ABC transporter permease [Clostridia bacterium]